MDLDDDDAVPPPIRRESREALRIQHALLGEIELEPSDSDEDDAAPPPIKRLRPPSQGPTPSTATASSKKPSTASNKQLASSLGQSAVPSKPLAACTNLPSLSLDQSTIVSKLAAASSNRPGHLPNPSAVSSSLEQPPTTTQSLPDPQRETSCLPPNRTLAPSPDRGPARPPGTRAGLVGNKDTSLLLRTVPLRRQQIEPTSINPNRPNHAQQYSHPSKDQTKPLPRPRYANSASYRKPPRALKNVRRPPYLRHWSSLETIDSVRTTTPAPEESPRKRSFDDSESILSTTTASSRRTFLTFDDSGEGGDDDDDGTEGENDGDDTEREDDEEDGTEEEEADDETEEEYESGWEDGPNSSAYFSSPPESSASSSLRSVSVTTLGSDSKTSISASWVRKLKRGAQSEPVLNPEQLELQRRLSLLGQNSQTSSSGSSMTISSGRPSGSTYPGSPLGSHSNLSVSNKDWKSSSYDTSGLTEAELKKCKKKGINPALYAEMKAARKGKFLSPIGGHTFI